MSKFKIIELESRLDPGAPTPRIRISKIKPFRNKCKVTGDEELLNVTLSYTPKGGKVVELGSYRKFFDRKFNMYVEDIAVLVWNRLQSQLNPASMTLVIWMEDPMLTPWSVRISDER